MISYNTSIVNTNVEKTIIEERKRLTKRKVPGWCDDTVMGATTYKDYKQLHKPGVGVSDCWPIEGECPSHYNQKHSKISVNL